MPRFLSKLVMEVDGALPSMRWYCCLMMPLKQKPAVPRKIRLCHYGYLVGPYMHNGRQAIRRFRRACTAHISMPARGAAATPVSCRWCFGVCRWFWSIDDIAYDWYARDLAHLIHAWSRKRRDWCCSFGTRHFTKLHSVTILPRALKNWFRFICKLIEIADIMAIPPLCIDWFERFVYLFGHLPSIYFITDAMPNCLEVNIDVASAGSAFDLISFFPATQFVKILNFIVVGHLWHLLLYTYA